MKINKMTNYAIRAIRAIDEEEGSVVTSKVIAEKEMIPHGVLMKVLRKLRQNLIIQSHQGRGELIGGFSLLKTPKEITLLDVIEVMEGRIVLNSPEDDNQNASNDKDSRIFEEFMRVNEILRAELAKHSLDKFFNTK